MTALPVNPFKAGLAAGRSQVGIWCTIPGPMVAEALATCGYDWVLLDTEHTVTDVPDILPMLQAVAGWPVAPVVRAQWNDPVLIKRLLDFGAQTLMLPYVQTADEARAAVRAMRYAPAGFRGVSGMTRATGYGRVAGYQQAAAAELCLIVQIETAAAVARIPEIAAVDGVDALFIGPADLAASMGHGDDTGHPEVRAMIAAAIAAIRAAGKPAGILTVDPVFARQCIAWGTTFTAVAVDMTLLVTAARGVRGQFAG
jgi:4-hydroxy-2-oxoheptanedioate aldolase